LINRSYPSDPSLDQTRHATQWQKFEHYINDLNNNSGHTVQYKVLLMGRHGEGHHNVAEAFYGTPAWDCHWSKLDGNRTMTWADAQITDKGTSQALLANAFWKKELVEAKIPAPQSYYTSPLDRCLATANLTFSGLALPSEEPFRPIVKEVCDQYSA
jgi:broad specificity phosphatase PhoE